MPGQGRGLRCPTGALGYGARMPRTDAFVLDHIAFGVPDAAAAGAFLAERLGARPHSSGPGGGPFLWWQWELAGGGRIELIEPAGPPDGFLHRFLDSRGPGPHHLTFKVPSVREAMGRAEALGYRPVGYSELDPSWIEVFLHPKEAQGIVVQLAEEHPEAWGDEEPAFERPPFPALPAGTPAGAARPLGVALTARDEKRARRQWGELLGGRETATQSGLRFHWPDSPLRVDVVIDLGAPEGPTALELSAPTDLALPEGRHPLLGLPLVQLEG